MSANIYVVRVRWTVKKGVWREIALQGSHTLDDLHRAIVEAYEWTSEETPYRFFMSEEMDDRERLFTPGGAQDTQQAQLDDFNLEEEDEFIYLYSDSENGQFRVRVMSIEDPEPGATYPDVIDELGESPEQPEA